jgi:hypothetical protein
MTTASERGYSAGYDDGKIYGYYSVILAGLEMKKKMLALRLASIMKKVQQYQNHIAIDHTMAAWCADLTEDLSGIVGTIEVPGEIGVVQIQPGYDGNAAYDADRDGQMQGTAAGDPAAVFYNLAMLPGWQKWMPTYRYGTITAIDTGADTCTVELDTAQSSAQSLDINHLSVLYNVPIEYMQCNSSAFEVGDKVLVKFDSVKGQTVSNWATAEVIGFKEEPKACEYRFFIKPTFNGLSAVKGTESIRLEYNFGGTDYQLNANVHGTRYVPTSYDLPGYAGPFTLVDPSHQTAEITAKVGHTYNPGTGLNSLFHAWLLVTIDDDYDVYRAYEGSTYYFKRVVWRPSAVKVFAGAKTSVVADGETFDCYEVPFTALKKTYLIPDSIAQTQWPKRYYNISECGYNYEDVPSAYGTTWSRVYPYDGGSLTNYSIRREYRHEVYITDRDPGWNRRTAIEINYGSGDFESPGSMADVGYCYGQPVEDTTSEWQRFFTPPDSFGGAFDAGLPDPIKLEHSCVIVANVDGDSPSFTNFVSRQRYSNYAQVFSLALGQLREDVEHHVAEWSYEMQDNTDF